MKRLLLVIVLLGCYGGSTPRNDAALASDEIGASRQQVVVSDTTSRLFAGVMAYAERDALHTQSIGEVMKVLGAWFLEKPYVAGTLDAPPLEKLVVKLDGFDCVTFVETALALARGVRNQDYTYETFAGHLTDQRYRGSTLDGYCSRLHYFSEWISDNEKKGTVENITADLGGVPLEKRLNFMSEHRSSYPHLASNDSLFAGIIEVEERIKSLPLFYIPQDRIRDVYPRLQSGDIIALATDIAGLDVSHTGLVYRYDDGRVGLLHASTKKGVTVSPDLQEYVENNRRQIGIVVARPAE